MAIVAVLSIPVQFHTFKQQTDASMERSLAWRLGLGSLMIPGLIALFVADHRSGSCAAPVHLLSDALFAVCSGTLPVADRAVDATAIRGVGRRMHRVNRGGMVAASAGCPTGGVAYRIVGLGVRRLPAGDADVRGGPF